jgi:D-alanyl-lipoteichoic acid acyltransferase DltB (MBOAT superfamily)
MTVHRYCLLGLPRTGSQYISGVINTTIAGNMQNLAEPFTHGHAYNIIQKNNFLYVSSMFPKFNSHREQIDYAMALLKNSNQQQSLVLKVFLTTRIFSVLQEILDTLKQLGFKFLIMKRENIEHHLLSWIVADATNKWSTDDGIHMDLVDLSTYNLANVEFLYKEILNFNKVIEEYKIDANIIRYENCIEDLTTYLQRPIIKSDRLKKQLPDNPYDIIKEPEKVKDFIKKLIT